VLQTTSWRTAMRLYSPAPLQSNQIKNQQIVEPGFAIASAEHKHIIADD
jgi:hypothetical protein